MRYVVTAEEMQALDRETIEGIGLPGVVLMENAGRAVVRIIEDLLAHDGKWSGDSGRSALTRDASVSGRPAPRIAVVCGGGNNGGDGYVIGRCLREAGMHVTVYMAARREAVKGDARRHLDVYENAGGLLVSVTDEASLFTHAERIRNAEVVVDAVFGTGLTREVSGHYRKIIETINQCGGHRVAVDIPSGLSADTGEVLGIAVNATCTVTMAFLKVGLATTPGCARCGDLHVAEIGIPDALAEKHGIRTALIEPDDLTPLLPADDAVVHKNRRGHVLAVAGSPGKRGAGRLVAWSALRAGAGLVTLASPWTSGEVYAPDPVMTEAFDAEAADALERLLALAEGKQVVAMGPGMPTSEGARDLVHAALAELEVPMVLDADALNHIGTHLERVATAKAPIILTPHPGEAARLLGRSSAAVQKDRVGAARALAARSDAIVVLKGARTLVCVDDFVTVNPSGHPALATAGTGDVLTGLIASLVAQGVSPADAARLGVFLHGRVGEYAAAALSSRGVTSADLAEHMPRAMNNLAAGAP
ncbi:bifunctional ADP-dependent NAD(P)H-hydrate dehydratase/NAD(P)H-hydrate epimerase [Haliangium ochraceum]|uniref:Bifunctional NAD(P)H-hydrate repair enzyme n=1 Tax=Haliangium ochraceum (strain DSM 14365 / JCM 11303 / SMP-2) TaxID=502025 RepID=D0LX65_HALO1|nr:bifunctional ADP-dependent NAD(P)H-hydrate dehydratase/NAD(P)H-hydrate epimerase [Haliangium ochraceum]ACY16107.1 carbohydrate kinase, YjeF related protein [Haliangium ochraceum DSM 14365]